MHPYSISNMIFTKGKYSLLEKLFSYSNKEHKKFEIPKLIDQIQGLEDDVVYLKLHLTDQTRLEIQNYKNTGRNDVVYNLLGNMTIIPYVSDHAEPYYMFEWETILYALCIFCFLVIVTRQTRNMSLYHMLCSVFTILFLVSVPWTWYKLYLAQLAQHQTTIISYRPKSCGQHPTFVTFLKSMFTLSQKDECLRYHEALLIHPMLEVPPTKALAVTLTNFIFEPLEHIGSSLSRMLRNMFADLPVLMWPCMAAYLVIISLFSIVTIVGCRTKVLPCITSAPKQSGLVSQSIVRHV